MYNTGSIKTFAIRFIMAFLILGISIQLYSDFAWAEEEGDLIRLAGADRYETAQAISEYALEKNGEKFDTVVLARGDDYADALSASYICGVSSCPIILVSRNDIKPALDQVKELLNPKGRVYIIGGDTAVPAKVESQLKSKEFTNIKRLAGKDRYETNFYILKEGDAISRKKNAGTINPKILVCSGKNYPDALSCGATGNPIMLTDGTVKSYQKGYIGRRNSKKFYIIGGVGAIPNSTQRWFQQAGPTTRVAGSDRYSTSIAIAKKFFSRSKKAVIVYGDNYPDGIAACSVAQINKAPILLSSKLHVAESYNYEELQETSSAVVIGGNSLVPDKLIALPGHVLEKGWNSVGKHYVFVNANGLVETQEFIDDGKHVYPSLGGAISPVLRDWLEWPVESVITSYFGYRSGLPAWASKNHGGIDIAIKYGTPVHAAADGKVIAPTGWYGGYGNVVFIRHAGGVVTVYGHNSRNLVSKGKVVKKGDVIGYVGSTGNSTGPHVHFEVRIDGVNKDPLLFLPKNQYWKGY